MELGKAKLTGMFIEVSIDGGEITTAEPFSKLGEEVEYYNGQITVRKNVTKALEYHSLILEVKMLKESMDETRDELIKEIA